MVSLSLLGATVCGFAAVLAASLVPNVQAAASDIPLDTIGGGLTKNDMDTIMSMVSIAENSNTEWWTNYNYCEDIHDGRGFTVSLVGFCSGTGDLLEVVRDVQRMSPNHPLVQFIPALVKANGSPTHKGLENLCSTIKSSGDSVWKKAVWQGIQRDYLSTALDWAAKKKLTSVFSKGFLFDVALNHGASGLDQIAGYVKSGVQPPSNGGGEVAYMQAYIQARIYVVQVIDPSTNNGQADRMLMWKSVLDKNNLGLQRPMTLKCYGETFTISGGNPPPSSPPPPPGLGDWEFCSVSSQCSNGCCSKQYSDDGKLKCTPGGTPSQCVGTSTPPTTPPSKLGDWQFCSASSQCQNTCCSKQYSDDGKLKCTPGGSRDQCV